MGAENGPSGNKASPPVTCVGDPYGVGCDCLLPATGFVFGAIPAEEGSPLIVAVPCCEVHGPLVYDWMLQASPLPHEVVAFDIAVLDPLRAEMEQRGDELWLYTRAAA